LKSLAHSDCNIASVASSAGGVTSAADAARSTPASPVDAISVLSATYGGKGRALAGNATRQVAAYCDGRQECDQVVDVTKLGDPAPNCGKNFLATFTCGLQTGERRVELPGEAGLKSLAHLDRSPVEKAYLRKIKPPKWQHEAIAGARGRGGRWWTVRRAAIQAMSHAAPTNPPRAHQQSGFAP
jgi:hypothetical protein